MAHFPYVELVIEPIHSKELFKEIEMAVKAAATTD
jgi:hypothetical protein